MFKKIISIILATTMVSLMSVTAFAQTNQPLVLKNVGQRDENGYTIVKSEVVETFDDGSYVLLTEGKKDILTRGSQIKSSSITYDFVGASGNIYDTVEAFASFEYNNQTVGFVNTYYEHYDLIPSVVKPTSFTDRAYNDSTGKAVYELKFRRSSGKYTMTIKCSKTGAITTSGDQSLTVLEP